MVQTSKAQIQEFARKIADDIIAHGFKSIEANLYSFVNALHESEIQTTVKLKTVMQQDMLEVREAKRLGDRTYRRPPGVPEVYGESELG